MASSLNYSILDTSLVPKDITFSIKDSGMEVRAHKTVLGMASPVFSNMFFGSLQETKDVILVEETTGDAFNSMIDFIYGKGIKWAADDNIEDIFAIGNIAKRYEIKALEAEVKKKVDIFKLTKENVVMIAATALEFVQFEDLSRAMFLRCAKYLRKDLLSVDNIVSFASKYSDTEYCQVAFKLVASIKDLGTVADVCQRCGKKEHGCVEGKNRTTYKAISNGDNIIVVYGNEELCDKGFRGTVLKKQGDAGFGGARGIVTVLWDNISATSNINVGVDVGPRLFRLY